MYSTEGRRSGYSDHIDIDEDYEVAYWRRALGVTENELIDAVATVGPTIANLRRYLQSKPGQSSAEHGRAAPTNNRLTHL